MAMHVKLNYNGDIRSLVVEDLNPSSIIPRALDLFSLTSAPLSSARLTYVDLDGDSVTLTNGQDVSFAMGVMLSTGRTIPLFSLVLTPPIQEVRREMDASRNNASSIPLPVPIVSLGASAVNAGINLASG